jgi:regulator of cell morphogenesis and NO signaling
MLNPTQSLADLALTIPAASRVFRRHRLDFCCGGKKSVAEACAARGLDVTSILQQIEADAPVAQSVDWQTRPLPELIDHILVNYHEPHRRELADLIELARKVERVHADKTNVPRGLTEHLAHMLEAMELHMQKEERILFPAIVRGMRSELSGPIHQMESEHDDHGESLRVLRDLASDFIPPPEACTSWRALFLRCEQLEADLMAHVHLENHVLFPRVLSSN